jgi:hypothetical protein
LFHVVSNVEGKNMKEFTIDLQFIHEKIRLIRWSN